ncbi:MAG: DUF2336 domain-containing protein [Kiloniellales bacterium]
MTSHRPTPTGNSSRETRRADWRVAGLALALGLCALAIGSNGTLAQTAEPRQDGVGTKLGIFEGFVEDSFESAADEPMALRGDDIERAIWFLEDQAASFGQLAAGDTNKHAKAAWLILEENYGAAAQTLERLRRDRRIRLADLDDGEAATLSDSVVLVDGTLDGAWPLAHLERVRQVGGDDWPLISQLSSVLLQQLGSFRTLDDWTWFKRHLRQSGSLQGPVEALDPALAAELIHFAAIKDKYLLAKIRTESAPSRQLAAIWRGRTEALAGEAEDFVLRHAAVVSRDSAARFARAWREYAESAKQAATAYAGVTFTAPPADAGHETAAASQTNGTPSRSDTRWPALGGEIDAVPERIKSHTTLSTARQAGDETAVAIGSSASQSAGTAAAKSAATETATPDAAPPDAVLPHAALPEAADSESPAPLPATAAAVETKGAAADPGSTEGFAGARETAPIPETAEPGTAETGTPEAGTGGPDASDQLALTELVQRAVEDEQAQQWREALNRETFQANGVTVPIRDETAPQSVPPLSTLESSAEPAAGAADAPTAAANGDGGSVAPLRPGAEAAPGAGQLRPGLAWLQELVERHRELIALLPVVVLLVLIVLVAAWLWRTSRGRAEEPLILTTALEDDPYAEASLAAAGAARQGQAPPRWSSSESGTASEAGRPEPAERPAFHSATVRSTTAGGPARRSGTFRGDPLDGEDATGPRRRSAAARSGNMGTDTADPYAQVRSELERSRPAAKMAGGEDASDHGRQVRAARSSAIAVMQAAARQRGDAASQSAQQSVPRVTRPSGEGEQETGPQALITAWRSGDARHFEMLFEQQTGLTRRDVRDLLHKAKPDELAIACRGIGVDQLAFASMVIMIRRRYLGEAEVPPHQLSSALAAFISTSPDEARSRLQSWSIDADFTPVEGTRDQGPTAGYSY